MRQRVTARTGDLMKQREHTCRRVLLLPLAFLCAVMFLLMLLRPFSSGAEENKSYIFSVVPQFPPLEIKRDWTPLLERISRDSGIPLQLKFYKSISEFEADVLAGTPDFVYLSPYHAVEAKKAHGYVPLVRDSEDRLVGILVVEKESPFRTVQDLNGKTLVFPSPNAFAASLYLRALLSQREKITFTPKYVTTHSNVYLHVAKGLAAAGGGVNRTLDKEPPELREKLRIIYRTPGVAPHPIAAHPRVPVAARKAVAGAIMKLSGDEQARSLLKNTGIPRPMRADYRRDYGQIELLGLDKFAAKGGE